MSATPRPAAESNLRAAERVVSLFAANETNQVNPNPFGHNKFV